MDQTLPRLSEVFLGDDTAQTPADPVGCPAAWISPVPTYLTLRAIRFMGLVFALILGLASISRSLAAREEASPSDVAIATALRVQPGFPVRVGHLRKGSARRSHEHLPAVPRIVHLYDPNDDTTSGDPDEDDDNETSDFLNGSDDTDVPIMAWCQEMAPCAIPLECAPVTWTAPPSSHFLTLQRLRC
jgi:hypothetical protein